MEGFKKKGCASSHSDCAQGDVLSLCLSWAGTNILTHGGGEKKNTNKKQARSMHCHSHGDLRGVLDAVAVESDLNGGDYTSFLLQSELNQAVVD